MGSQKPTDICLWGTMSNGYDDDEPRDGMRSHFFRQTHMLSNIA